MARPVPLLAAALALLLLLVGPALSQSSAAKGAKGGSKHSKGKGPACPNAAACGLLPAGSCPDPTACNLSPAGSCPDPIACDLSPAGSCPDTFACELVPVKYFNEALESVGFLFLVTFFRIIQFVTTPGFVTTIAFLSEDGRGCSTGAIISSPITARTLRRSSPDAHPRHNSSARRAPLPP
jgi:hypothetical protein